MRAKWARDGRIQVLVLTRREGETVMIGDKISIRVQAVENDRVSLAIDAPDDVPVHRLEVWLQLPVSERRRRTGRERDRER